MLNIVRYYWGSFLKKTMVLALPWVLAAISKLGLKISDGSNGSVVTLFGGKLAKISTDRGVWYAKIDESKSILLLDATVKAVCHDETLIDLTMVPGAYYSFTANDLGVKAIQVTNDATGMIEYYYDNMVPGFLERAMED